MSKDIISQIQVLTGRRAELTAELSAIDATLNQVRAQLNGGSTLVGGGKTAVRDVVLGSGKAKVADGRSMSLGDHLQTILRRVRKPVGVPDLVASVQAAGYKSKSKNFHPLVNQMLIKDKRFKKTGRGVYTLR
jgi:hypothetical protein